MLDGASPKPLAAATDERFDIAGGEGAETPRAPLVPDMRQQCGRRFAMGLDRGARQPANLLQIDRERSHSVLDPRTRPGREQ